MNTANSTLRRLEPMKTKANTEFSPWWAALNAELAKRGLPEAGFGDASGCYEVGECPETAAANFEAMQ